MTTDLDDVRKTLSKSLEKAKRDLAELEAHVKKLAAALDLLGGPLPTARNKLPVSTRTDCHLPQTPAMWFVEHLDSTTKRSFDEWATQAATALKKDVPNFDANDMRRLRERLANHVVKLCGAGTIEFEGKKGSRRYWRKPFPQVGA